MAEKVKKATKPRATADVKVKTAEAAPKKAPAKKKAAPKPKGKVMQMVSQEEIAALAHRFWQERGGHHGSDAEDWHRAEQMLLGKAS